MIPFFLGAWRHVCTTLKCAVFCCCEQQSLAVLNVSGCGVTSLTDLHCLHQLRHLAATDNRLVDVVELTQLLSQSWTCLQRLDVANNPLCRRNKYRDYLIIAAPALGQRHWLFVKLFKTSNIDRHCKLLSVLLLCCGA